MVLPPACCFNDRIFQTWNLRATQNFVYLNYFSRPISWLVYFIHVPWKLENYSQNIFMDQVCYLCNLLRWFSYISLFKSLQDFTSVLLLVGVHSWNSYVCIIYYCLTCLKLLALIVHFIINMYVTKSIFFWSSSHSWTKSKCIQFFRFNHQTKKWKTIFWLNTELFAFNLKIIFHIDHSQIFEERGMVRITLDGFKSYL